MNKQLKKVLTNAKKTKETHKQLTNITKKTAEYEATTSAVKEIFNTFIAAGFPGVSHPTESNQAPVIETVNLEDSEAMAEENDNDTVQSTMRVADDPPKTPDATTDIIMGRPQCNQQKITPSDTPC